MMVSASNHDDAERPAPSGDGVAESAAPHAPLFKRLQRALPLLWMSRMMRMLHWVPVVVLLGLATGCAQFSQQRSFGTTWQDSALSAAETQSALMSLSEKVMFCVADTCERISSRTSRADTRLRCATLRLGTGLGALGAATGPNPYVGLVDLVTFVTLQRMSFEEPWASETFDEEDRLELLRTFAAAERDVWERADQVLVPEQRQELRGLILEWRAANPDRRDLASVRLQEFATGRQVGAGTPRTVPPNSVFALLWVDPTANLPSATRELQESRLLAERLAFFGKRASVVLGWQVELTSARLLNSDAAQQLLQNSAQFTSTLGDFSASAERLATSYERTLDELPKERAAAIEQIQQVLDRQISAFIDQSSAALTAERTAAFEQLGQEFTKSLEVATERLTRDFEVQRTQTLDRVAELLVEQQEKLSAKVTARLGEVEMASQRLVDRIALALMVVVLGSAVAIASIAFAYRRLDARFSTAARPPRD